MRKIGVWIGAISLLSILCMSQSFAQQGMQWRGGGGWGIGAPYNKIYDPKTVETISGEVVSVDIITPMKGMCYGVHLMVKADKETISVHLGPGWYIENQDTKIEPKDKVEVTGSRVTLEGKPVIIAAEVRKGEEILKLRNKEGFPLWSGWRRR
ncbi:MAG: DNA-binding protein [Candidatus Brocadia sp.]|nr:DNA-binding protein [Candidatus Brocadia sp.]